MTNDWMTFILGGGALSLIIGMLTLRARVRKVESEAVALDLQNSRSATEILIRNIVEPLKKELSETRKEFVDTKREMQRLRRAIRSANVCEYHQQCPVLHQLRKSPKDGGGEVAGDSNGTAFTGGKDVDLRAGGGSAGEVVLTD